jgi:hypothetical protein
MRFACNFLGFSPGKFRGPALKRKRFSCSFLQGFKALSRINAGAPTQGQPAISKSVNRIV